MSQKFILLVENDANLRQSIALILQRTGYIVTSTDCVVKALELLHSLTYHLLISDVNMSETCSHLLPTIAADYPHLPVIILTDQSISEVDAERDLFGAHYLLKPVAPERLLDSVGSIVNKKSNNQVSNQVLPVDRPG